MADRAMFFLEGCAAAGDDAAPAKSTTQAKAKAEETVRRVGGVLGLGSAVQGPCSAELEWPTQDSRLNGGVERVKRAEAEGTCQPGQEKKYFS